MTTHTTIQISPEELADLIMHRVQARLGSHATAQAITPDELPDLSAQDAARYLGCSVAHLGTIVTRWPEHICPITAAGKAVRYKTAELIFIKYKNLTKSKPL